MRPCAPQNRCVKVFTGHQHNFEKNLLKCNWSPDGQKVTSGSADRMVYIWDTTSRSILYKLPGHSGCVNETAMHSRELLLDHVVVTSRFTWEKLTPLLDNMYISKPFCESIPSKDSLVYNNTILLNITCT